MNRLWKLVTENPDGSPLLGYRLAGPIGIAITLGAILGGLLL